ncbi:CBS domain-containing protein CBSCBSPB5-like [Rutidosis leptorrhynchoides]|uniref:CBS domain-containing protein CBSCBSPB5-like n=1 Tax=Rutidosis leptorrhynchoides TaxID=125765 RepID=UPI003A993FF9
MNVSNTKHHAPSVVLGAWNEFARKNDYLVEYLVYTHHARACIKSFNVDNKPVGILTSKDILMRVIAQDLRPELILVENVMTPNPECATLDTPIVNALHNMHDGNYLHLPVIDREGAVIAIVDVLQITHAAITTVGNTTGINNEVASSMMWKFWDSAMAITPVEEDDEIRSVSSFRLMSEADSVKSFPHPLSMLPNTFGFKIQDKHGRMHRFICSMLFLFSFF